MRGWIFFGRVLPERQPLQIGAPDPISWSAEFDLLQLKYDLEFRCAQGQLVVRVVIREGGTDLLTLRNLVEQGIRPVIDLIGYRDGVSFDMELISAVSLETGEGVVFGIQIPVIAQTRTGKKERPVEEMKIVASLPAAQIVLADFREAMRVPLGTGFFCYRAIEAMQQFMRAENESDNAAWQRMRGNLRIERVAIDYVKKFADLPRHGKPSPGITDNERAQVFKITDEIIGRFLEYLLRGEKPLGNRSLWFSRADNSYKDVLAIARLSAVAQVSSAE